MKSRVIGLLILGSMLVGGVQASAATITSHNVTVKKVVYYKKCRPIKPLPDINVPASPDEDIKDNNTIVPPANEGNNDSNIVTPPANEGSIEDNAVSSDKFMEEVEQAIFNKVNEERAKAGMPSLSYNSTMEKYARIKSQDMGDNNYFNHADLNGNYITTKMESDGVSYKAWGENIAYIGGVSDPTALAEEFMKNWMNSEGHRKNILSANFESIGIGVYKAENRVYATQEFYR